MPLSALYEIGKIVSKDKDELDSLIEPINLKKKQLERENYNLKILFDLKNNSIEISKDLLSEFKTEDVKCYLYCGNNSARAKQYFLTRLASKGLKYTLGKMFFDLREKMKELSLNKENKLFEIVDEVIKSELYDYDKNDNRVDEENKKFHLNKINSDEKINDDNITEEMIKRIIFGKQRNEYAGKNLQLIIPMVKLKNGEEYILPKCDEYKELLLLTSRQYKDKEMFKNKYCYVCNREVHSSSSHISKFPRDAITKIFITDKTNYASQFDKNNYDKNYQFCENCKNILLNAEKFIKNNLRFTMAGVSTFIIPSFLIKDLDIQYENGINAIKERVELAFYGETLSNFIESLQSDVHFLGKDIPMNLTFLNYETDGNSFKIVGLMKDIPDFNFIKLIRILNEEHLKFIDEIKYFNLNMIYKIIPLKFGKMGISSTRNNVLELYNNLLNFRKISNKVLYSYFCQALYCSFYEQFKMYKNLLQTGSFDYAIHNLFFYYLILFNTMKRLNLFFEENKMENSLKSTEIQKDKKQKFLDQQGFNEQQQALFYLGCLINEVGIAQYNAKHKHKPILNKINYQGMTKNDIKRLFLEVFEKLVQYRKLSSYVEKDNSKFKKLFDRNFENWQLNDEENVFFLLSGYAYKMSSINKSTDNNKETNNIENTNEEVQNG